MNHPLSGTSEPGPDASQASHPAEVSARNEASSGVGYELRAMREGDLPIVARLEAELFGAEAWSKATLVHELEYASGAEADRGYVIAHSPAGDILGYAGAWWGDGRGDADLLTIATIPAARRRGIARALLDHLIGRVQAEGCRHILLEVRASNTGAQALYESAGFRRIGHRRRYYQAPVEDALIMRRALTNET